MAKSQLRAKKVASLKKLKSSLKSGSSNYLERIPDGERTVRFLTEPTEWIDYSEHYDEINKFFPCVVGECPSCLEGNKPSGRYLTAALDRDEDKVIPLVLPKSLAGILTRRYDRYQTLLDRDYILEREGQGFDTSYDATPEAPSKIRLSKYDLPDLWALLEAQLLDADNDDDDDDDEEETPVAKKASKSRTKAPVVDEDDDDEDDDIDVDDEDDEEEAPPVKKRSAKKIIADTDDEEDDDEEEDDDDDDDDGLERDRLEALGIRELKAKAKEAGATVADLKGKSKEEVVDLILAADSDDDDPEEDDDDELTEDELEAMSLAELKGICKEYGVKVPRGADKDTLIDLLLEEAEGDE